MRLSLGMIHSLAYRSEDVFRLFRQPQTLRRFALAARRYQSSVPRLMLRALELYRIGRFTPEESLSRGLIDPSVPLSAHEEHFSEERLHAMQIAINSPNVAVCRDKLLFQAYCAQQDLPTARLLGLVSAHGSRGARGEMLARDEQWRSFVETLPPSFIVKPRGGNKGRSVRLFGTALQSEGDPVASLIRALLRLPESGDDWILEERIEVHARIAQMTGTGAVSTARVVTLIEGDAEPRIMGSHFRVIAGDSITDNISDWQTGKFSGNILAVPDLDTGVVTEAWAPNPDGIGYQWVKSHPRTGVPIEGFPIPCWDEVRRLVTRAATCFLPLRTVGWDVAITDDGPLLIEGNEQYQYSGFGPRVVRLRAALKREQARLAGLRTRAVKARN